MSEFGGYLISEHSAALARLAASFGRDERGAAVISSASLLSGETLRKNFQSYDHTEIIAIPANVREAEVSGITPPGWHFFCTGISVICDKNEVPARNPEIVIIDETRGRAFSGAPIMPDVPQAWRRNIPAMSWGAANRYLPEPKPFKHYFAPRSYVGISARRGSSEIGAAALRFNVILTGYALNLEGL